MTFDSEYDGFAWLTLLLQAGGIVLAAFVLHALRRRFGRATTVAAAAALAVLVLSSALALPQARDQVREARDFRASNEVKVETEKRLQCLTQATLDQDFLTWARDRIPRGSTYWLVLSDTFVQIDGQFCTRYFMLPAVQARSRREADFFLFYEDLPPREVEFVTERDGEFLVPDPENEADRALVDLRPPEERR